MKNAILLCPMSGFEEWLTNEDKECREGRLARLQWMESQFPQYEYFCFHGGEMVYYLFEETRYCFIYGQFLATVVMGLAFMEQSLAAYYYATGRDDLERANASTLFTIAFDGGLITQTEFKNLERARHNRNPITHFHEYFAKDRIELRSFKQSERSYALLENDAYNVMETIFHLIEERVLCWAY
jgi:hypothetical protein